MIAEGIDQLLWRGQAASGESMDRNLQWSISTTSSSSFSSSSSLHLLLHHSSPCRVQSPDTVPILLHRRTKHTQIHLPRDDCQDHSRHTTLCRQTTSWRNDDTTERIVACCVQNYFSTFFNRITPPLRSTHCPPACPFLDDLLCTEEEIHLYLSTLDASRATGPDGISARILKSTAGSITKFVSNQQPLI